MSGKTSGLGDQFLYGGYLIGGDIQAVSVNGGPALLDSTDITQRAHSRLGGERDGGIALVAYSDQSAGMEHAAFSPLTRSDVICTYLRGQAVGNPAASMQARQVNYDPTRAADGALTEKVDAQADAYGLEWGTQLTAGPRTDTGAANGAAYNQGASSSYGAQAYLQAVSFTGTDATVTIQHSTDNSSWSTLMSFAQVIGAMKILAPLYIYPSPATSWNTVVADAPAVQYIIANPASGPGTTVDSNYASVITAAQAAGITVLGYVDTNYTAVATGTVSTNVARWQSLYGVTSIFFDQVSSDGPHLGYYTTVCGYVGGKKVLNCGTVPVQGYADISDVLILFESPTASWSSFTPPSWIGQYSPARFCVLVYNVSGSSAMNTVVTQAQGYGIGVCYVTDEADDLFNALPTYLASEVTEVNATAVRSAPLAQRISVANNTTVDQYLRAVTTTSAGFTSLKFAVQVTVNPVAGQAF